MSIKITFSHTWCLPFLRIPAYMLFSFLLLGKFLLLEIPE